MPNDTLTLVDIQSLTPHPQNPRQGDVGAIAEMIATTGWHGAVEVQKKRNGQRIIGIGNHRYRALRSLQQDGFTDREGNHHSYAELRRRVNLPPDGKVPVIEHNWSDEMTKRKLIQDNRASDLALNDDDLTTAHLRELADTPLSLDGTGFDLEDLDARVIAPRRGDAGVQNVESTYAVVIECDNEAEQRALLEELSARSLRVRAIVT